MLPLTDRDYQSARDAIQFARERIKRNRGKYGYETIDKLADRAGSGWAKKLLKQGARKWSLHEALKLGEALERCEIARTTEAFCREHDGISERELRRRYNDRRSGAVAEASKKTGEVVNGIGVTQGGVIPAEYHDWLASQADPDTLRALQGMRHGLLFRQVAAAGTQSGEPYVCAILYEPNAANTIASEIARFLADQNVIRGARKEQHRRAYDSLVKLFAGTDEAGSFRDRCRWAFWSQYRRWNVEETLEGLSPG